MPALIRLLATVVCFLLCANLTLALTNGAETPLQWYVSFGSVDAPRRAPSRRSCARGRAVHLIDRPNHQPQLRSDLF